MIKEVSILRRGRNKESEKKGIISHVVDTTESHYVGLINQENTCYLNTCMQTLYMTPELRNSLYSCKRSENKNTFFNSNINGAILLQIQQLFVNLQTSQKSAITTNSLTSSFGWSDNDARTQHDVKEFLEALLNIIENQLEQTAQVNFVDELYKGNMKDFIKCSVCNTERNREISFHNISLPLRCADSNLGIYGSVESSLQAYLAAETLDGPNKYLCDVCKTEVTATKGLKIIKLPYILNLQINRFGIDYDTQEVIKLNDKFTFPLILNLNWCLQPISDEKCLDVKTLMTLEGPYMYELFSIILHSGTPHKGHYFAYIKDFRTGKWQRFDDHLVTTISQKEIVESYGDGSNKNAYVLTYRQIDANKNALPITVSQFPQHLKELAVNNEKCRQSVTKESQNDSITKLDFDNKSFSITKVDSENQTEDATAKWDNNDAGNSIEDECIAYQYVHLLSEPAPINTELYSANDYSADEMQGDEKVLKWIEHSDFHYSMTNSCLIMNEQTTEDKFSVFSYPTANHYSEKIKKKYEMTNKSNFVIDPHVHCDQSDANKDMEVSDFVAQVADETMQMALSDAEEVPPCSYAKESSAFGDSMSTKTSASSTVLIFINPETTIVQDQLIGDKAKVLIKWDNGKENLLTFALPKNECCTVRDLLEEAEISPSQEINVMLHTDPAIANYVVHVRSNLQKAGEKDMSMLANINDKERITIYPPPPAVGGFAIMKSHLNCLREGQYVNDIIIDFYLTYLLREIVTSSDRERSYLFSSFFFKRISSFENEDDMKVTEYKYKLVQRWTKNINLFKYDFIIFPINLSKHWFLVIFCFANKICKIRSIFKSMSSKSTKCEENKKPCILIFDSLGGNRSEVANMLRDYLNFECDNKMKEKDIFAANNLPILHLKVPLQKNFTDCGIYVLQYAESFFLNPIKDYTTLEMQRMDKWFDGACITNKREDIKKLVYKLAVKDK